MTTYNYVAALNKIQNGHCMQRTAWSGAYYIFVPYSSSYIYCYYVNNINNPCALYSPTLADMAGTDWNELD